MNESSRHAVSSGVLASKVLVVDDEAQALKWLARGYGNEFDVLTAGSAEQAIAILDERAQEVAVLLTDHRMPVRHGISLLSEVRERYGHISRILMSAYADKELAMDAVNLGHVEAILEKPLDDVQTRQVLRQAIGASQERQRNKALLDRREQTLRETLGFLAHEVGTPLATVSGYLSAMQGRQREEDGGDGRETRLSQRRPGEIKDMLEAAQRRTEYAKSLVSTFVRTARDAYQADGSASLRASDLVRSVCEGYPFERDEAQWVRADIVGDFTLPGQRDLLYLVLCTLVKNALLALHSAPPSAPSVVVRAQGAPVEGERPGRSLIQVIDNGPGVEADVLARLTLEPVTTRAAAGGSGMGLVFCRRVMQSLGGSIEVTSERGKGTKIHLYFESGEGLHAKEVSG